MTFMAFKLYFIASCRHSEQQQKLRLIYPLDMSVGRGGGAFLQKIQRMLPCHKNGAETWKLPWAFTREERGAIREKSRGK